MTRLKRNNIIIKKYTYDGLGRLSREDNADLQKTYIFVYDNSGNVLTKNEYEYTIGSLDGSTPINTYSYTYNKNMLVSVVKNNNTSTMLICTYPTVGDTSKTQIGNPLTYCGKSLSWSKVHQLSSFNGLTFGYDYAGIRTRKGNIKFAYEQDKLIVQRNADGSKIIFYYGLDGLTGFNYNNQTYVYKKNIFGDIIGIYRVTATINEDDEISYSSTLVAKYVYDAWGNHKVLDANSGVGNNSADFIGNINLFRYRGYYFDVETDLYYLQSRYYDPSVGRFISMDKVEYIDSESINGVNLFVYCGNDPLNNSDPKGNLFFTALLIGATVGFALSFASSAISQSVTKQEVNWAVATVDGLFGAVSGALALTTLNPVLTGAIDGALAIANGYITSGMENNWEYTNADHISIIGNGLLSGIVSGIGKSQFLKSGGKAKIKSAEDFAKTTKRRFNNKTYAKRGNLSMRIKSVKQIKMKNNKFFFDSVVSPKDITISLLQSLCSEYSNMGLNGFKF